METDKLAPYDPDKVTAQHIHMYRELWNKKHAAVLDAGQNWERAAGFTMPGDVSDPTSGPRGAFESAKEEERFAQQAYEEVREAWYAQGRSRIEKAMLRLGKWQMVGTVVSAVAMVFIVLLTWMQVRNQMKSLSPTQVTCTWPTTHGATK